MTVITIVYVVVVFGGLPVTLVIISPNAIVVLLPIVTMLVSPANAVDPLVPIANKAVSPASAVVLLVPNPGNEALFLLASIYVLR